MKNISGYRSKQVTRKTMFLSALFGACFAVLALVPLTQR